MGRGGMVVVVVMLRLQFFFLVTDRMCLSAAVYRRPVVFK